MEIITLLDQRSKTHGSFEDNARIFEALLAVIALTPNWDKLHPEQRLAATMSMLKWARILSTGAPVDFKEPWDDLAGYPILGGKACRSNS